jgi:Flp pilus assembly protein TadG
MAIIQFGLVFNNYLNLTDAVRAGARVASVSATAGDPKAVTEAAVDDAANGLDTAKLNVDANDLESPSLWRSGDHVKVTATYPYTISIFGISMWSGTLSGSTTERVE